MLLHRVAKFCARVCRLDCVGVVAVAFVVACGSRTELPITLDSGAALGSGGSPTATGGSGGTACKPDGNLKCGGTGGAGNDGGCQCNGAIVTCGGGSMDCTPFRCTSSGSCLGSCSSDADCAPGFRCRRRTCI